MAMTYTDAGLQVLAKAAVGNTAAADLKLHIYTAVSPAISGASTVGQFTEAAAPGYSSKTLTMANWTFSTASNIVTAAYPDTSIVCTSNGGGEVWLGYMISNTANTVCIGAEAFSSSFTPASGGDALHVQPNFAFKNC